MKNVKRFLSFVLLSAMMCPMVALPTAAAGAAKIDFLEDFSSYSANTVYPSNKLWVSAAQFMVKAEGGNRYLRMPFYEKNSDAAICPFRGTVSAAHGMLLVRMDLRPVYREGNATSKYDFRVRNYTHTNAAGETVSDKWKTFFRLHLESEDRCYLSELSGSSVSEIPLLHDEWNTVFVSFDLVNGTYAVTVGEYSAICDLGIKSFGFAGDQLQFNQMQKGCTFAASAATASYVDIDNIALSTDLIDVSRYEGMLSSAEAQLRADRDPEADGAYAMGLRFVTNVDLDLFEELLQMRETGKALSVRVGTLIAPADYLKDTELTRMFSTHARLDVVSKTDFPNSYYIYNAQKGSASIAGSISHIMEENLGREFLARAYVEVLMESGQQFTVYSNVARASAKELATAALASSVGTDSATVQKLLTHCSVAAEFDGGEELRLMSYNIYYSDLREARMDAVAEMIEKYSPDIMGLQESNTTEWKAFLLDRFGDQYGYVGAGREAGGVGEATPILYREDKYRLIESDTLWLSDTPYECSKYPASRQNRIFTYALLARKSDGKKFLVVNTHLDTTGSEARLLQIASLKKQLQDLCLDDYPLLLTGDMNAKRSADSGELDALLSMGLTDAYDLALSRNQISLDNGLPSVIDYCLVESDLALVTKYVRDTSTINGEGPSDHAPVIIEIRF